MKEDMHLHSQETLRTHPAVTWAGGSILPGSSELCFNWEVPAKLYFFISRNASI